MSWRGLAFVGVAALLTAVANMLLRGGVVGHGGLSLSPRKILSDLYSLLTQPLFVTGVIFYGLAALVWFAVLGMEDLSSSYPLLVGLTFVLVATGAVFFYGELLSLQKLIGMAVILTGVAVVARA